MDNVSISFSGRSGGRVGTSFGGKLPKGHGFESRPDFKLMECRPESSHHLKSCPLVGAYGQKVNIQGSRYWVSHVGNNEPRILV
jgi:hypothetical protein